MFRYSDSRMGRFHWTELQNKECWNKQRDKKKLRDDSFESPYMNLTSQLKGKQMTESSNATNPRN